MAGIVDKTTIWPKRLWVDVYEKYQRVTTQQLIKGKFRNMNIVSYRRIPGCNSYGSDSNSFSSWVKPLHWRRAYKYADLDSFADVIVEVPRNATDARLLVNKLALARQRREDASSLHVAKETISLYNSQYWRMLSASTEDAPGSVFFHDIAIGEPLMVNTWALDTMRALYRWNGTAWTRITLPPDLLAMSAEQFKSARERAVHSCISHRVVVGEEALPCGGAHRTASTDDDGAAETKREKIPPQVSTHSHSLPYVSRNPSVMTVQDQITHRDSHGALLRYLSLVWPEVPASRLVQSAKSSSLASTAPTAAAITTTATSEEARTTATSSEGARATSSEGARATSSEGARATSTMSAAASATSSSTPTISTTTSTTASASSSPVAPSPAAQTAASSESSSGSHLRTVGLAAKKSTAATTATTNRVRSKSCSGASENHREDRRVQLDPNGEPTVLHPRRNRRRRSLTYGLDRFHLSSSALLDSLPDSPAEHVLEEVNVTTDGYLLLLTNLGLLFSLRVTDLQDWRCFPLPRAFIRWVSARSINDIWAIDYQDHVYHWDGIGWMQYDVTLKQLSAAKSDETVYGLDDNGALLYFEASTRTWHSHQTDRRFRTVAVGSAKHIWAIDTNFRVCVWEENRFVCLGGSIELSQIVVNGCGQALAICAMSPTFLRLSRHRLEARSVYYFDKIWDDRGTAAAPHDIGLWKLKLDGEANNFHALGDIAERSHLLDPQYAGLVVREIVDEANPPDSSMPMSILSFPHDYRLVWTDRGSGSKYGPCAIWKPLAPHNYVSLGYVATSSRTSKPALSRVVCIHKRFAAPAKVISEPLWKSYYTKVRQERKGACSLWLVAPSESGLFANTFVAVPEHAAPTEEVFGFAPFHA